jgi:ring-1,2-phenylacetyl-CoA epoxidase subunit PaaD
VSIRPRHNVTLYQLDRHKATLCRNDRVDAARVAAAAVLDPELPVLTIEDLGVLRGVSIDDDGRVIVTITPTYSGCPAMDAIRTDIVAALESAGFPDAVVQTVLSPPWSTDWISAAGRQKLQDFGIAPPAPRDRTAPVLLTLTVRCARCGSADTRETSRFGSTACKSLWACNSCLEPFDHVKPI